MSVEHIKVDENLEPVKSGMNKNLDAKTVAETLSKDDNSKTLLLAGTGVALTLPAVADIEAGWNIRAQVSGNIATTNFTIVSQTNVIQGVAVVNGASVPAVNENTISFVVAPTAIGDYVDIVFDGTNFLVTGIAAAAGAITFTAP